MYIMYYVKYMYRWVISHISYGYVDIWYTVCPTTPVRRSLQQTVGETSQGKINFWLRINENRFKYKFTNEMNLFGNSFFQFL